MFKRNLICACGTFLAAAACVTADTTDYVMTDFEFGSLTTPLNGYWYTFTDQNTISAADTTLFGNSRITSLDSNGSPFYDSLWNYDVRTFPVGRLGDTATKSYRFAFEFGDRKLSCGAACSYDPYVGFGMRFTTKADTLDLTGATHISFWAKAEKDSVIMDVSVGTRDTTPNSADYGQTFVIGPVWKQYAIRLERSADFKQPTWAAAKPFNPSVATGVGFGINKGSNMPQTANGVLIDDLVIQDWVYVEPVVEEIPDGIASRRAQAGLARLRAVRGQDGLHVALPERYREQGGEVQAVDAAGSIRARAAFRPGAREAVLPLAGNSTANGLLLRVIQTH